MAAIKRIRLLLPCFIILTFFLRLFRFGVVCLKNKIKWNDVVQSVDARYLLLYTCYRKKHYTARASKLLHHMNTLLICTIHWLLVCKCVPLYWIFNEKIPQTNRKIFFFHFFVWFSIKWKKANNREKQEQNVDKNHQEWMRVFDEQRTYTVDSTVVFFRKLIPCCITSTRGRGKKRNNE